MNNRNGNGTHSLSRRSFLKSAGAAVAAAPLAVNKAHAAPSKRNIVFVLIDDLRFDTLSFMGHPHAKTPNIDRLAREGVHFENAFVTTSLCSPSRASILTGLYAHKHQILNNSTLLSRDVTTFPKLLQQNGYATGFTGKWHMGGERDDPRPGFDFWASFKGQGNYYNQKFNVDGTYVETEGHISDRITDFSVDFIKKNKAKPFMLYMSHKAVHADFYPAERHRGKYADAIPPQPVSYADTAENYRGKPQWVKNQRNSWHGVDGMYNHRYDFTKFYRGYLETVLSVDESIGRLMQTLEDEGVADNTLIIFMGDNGFLFGEHGLIDKRCMYEPSIRVPMIAWCPSLTKGNVKRSEMVLNIDIAPTILEAAGIEPPSSMHGASFLPLIQNRDTSWRTEFLYEYFWERAFPQTPSVLGLRTDQYSYMRYHGVWDLYELYDIQKDPDQMNNLLDGVKQTTEAGNQLNLIRGTELYDFVMDLQGRMFDILEKTGGRTEPTWLQVRS